VEVGSRFLKLVRGAPVSNENTPHRLLDVPASSAWFHPIISLAKNTAYHIRFFHENVLAKSFLFYGDTLQF
jgi:hypothetical protein